MPALNSSFNIMYLKIHPKSIVSVNAISYKWYRLKLDTMPKCFINEKILKFSIFETTNNYISNVIQSQKTYYILIYKSMLRNGFLALSHFNATNINITFKDLYCKPFLKLSFDIRKKGNSTKVFFFFFQFLKNGSSNIFYARKRVIIFLKSEQDLLVQSIY